MATMSSTWQILEDIKDIQPQAVALRHRQRKGYAPAERQRHRVARTGAV